MNSRDSSVPPPTDPATTAIVPREAASIPAKAKSPVRERHDVERTDALSRYFSQLRDHAPISREEEHELALRWTEHGDADAARRLVLANLRLVVKIAMEYRRTWTNVLDLIQEGNVGLMQAVKRFDPYQGVKLSSYAAYWIRAYVLKYLLDNIRLVRLGTTRAQRKLFFRLNKEKRELERLGIEVEPRLIAERLDVTEEDVVDMEQRLGHSDLSIDAPVQVAAPQELTIQAEADGYRPAQASLASGHPIRLKLVGSTRPSCTNAIVFPGLDLERQLLPGRTTLVDLPPQPPGKLSFVCGMGMYGGAIDILPRPAAPQPPAPAPSGDRP